MFSNTLSHQAESLNSQAEARKESLQDKPFLFLYAIVQAFSPIHILGFSIFCAKLNSAYGNLKIKLQNQFIPHNTE